MSNRVEKDYLLAIKQRDNKLIQEIYDKFYNRVLFFVLKNNGSNSDAKEIFDLAIYQISARLNREDFKIKSNFEAFLFTACKNLWRRQLNKISKRRVTNEDVKELYYKEKEQTQSTLEQERWELFHEKVNNLSENCQRVLSLFFKKFGSREIMQEMNYESENTVRQRIYKCKKKLMSLVKQDARFLELISK